MEKEVKGKPMTPVKLRLKEFIATQGISEREFCRRIGVSSAYVESIKQSISPKVMQAISIHFPQLNHLWLLLGTGEMINQNVDPAPVLAPAPTPAPAPQPAIPTEMLAELLDEARNEKKRLLTTNEKLASIIESQQITISDLTAALKKTAAQPGGGVACVDAG